LLKRKPRQLKAQASCLYAIRDSNHFIGGGVPDPGVLLRGGAATQSPDRALQTLDRRTMTSSNTLIGWMAHTLTHLVPTRTVAGAIEVCPTLPILVVENSRNGEVPLSQAVRVANFINPITCLDDESLPLYLDGTGIYRNRKKHPLPAIILQDVTLPKLRGLQSSLPWLEQPRDCRYVVVTVLSGEVEPRHFESAVPFGPYASLCKLEFTDSMEDMFVVLRRACIEP
jgi:hypothetical protein